MQTPGSELPVGVVKLVCGTPSLKLVLVMIPIAAGYGLPVAPPAKFLEALNYTAILAIATE